MRKQIRLSDSFSKIIDEYVGKAQKKNGFPQSILFTQLLIYAIEHDALGIGIYSFRDENGSPVPKNANGNYFEMPISSRKR